MVCVGSLTRLSPASTSTATQPLTAHLLPLPRPFEHNCCLPLPLCLFGRNCSSPPPTVSIWVWTLVTHLNQSSNLHFSPLPCPIERSRSSPTSVISNWARTLTFHLYCVNPSAIAHPQWESVICVAKCSYLMICKQGGTRPNYRQHRPCLPLRPA